MLPEVSVVIPTYNRRAMVREAIASVIAQRGARIELIAVDDGSTDGTAEELDRIAASANSDCIIMRVVCCENRGPAAARNAGVALASAPMLAFLDSDDLWMPHKLQRQIAFMRARPGCAISQTAEIWIRDGRRVNPGLRHRKRAGDLFIDSLRTCLISPSAVIMRTEAFRAAGGFDERMAAAEDYDLWLRILANCEVGLLPEPLTTRRAGHPGQLSATVPAIDRFRILALMKLLAVHDLDEQKRYAVSEVLSEKCAIYAQGLRRRGRVADAELIADLGARAVTAWGERVDDSLHDSIERMLATIARVAFSGTSARMEPGA
jgi:glycosyltransferase involved in cell wall biosynthesis